MVCAGQTVAFETKNVHDKNALRLSKFAGSSIFPPLPSYVLFFSFFFSSPFHSPPFPLLALLSSFPSFPISFLLLSSPLEVLRRAATNLHQDKSNLLGRCGKIDFVRVVSIAIEILT